MMHSSGYYYVKNKEENDEDIREVIFLKSRKDIMEVDRISAYSKHMRI